MSARETVEEPAAEWAQRLRARLAADDYDLPMLPRVATEVVQITATEDVDSARLAALIHQDPALAAAVLRVSNAPAYLPRTPIVSLQQAVMRLGFVTLSEIALTASLQSGVFRVGRHEARLAALWQYSVASAGFARELARARRANVENAFLCGLLHGIGRPAVLQLVADLEASDQSQIPDAVLAQALEDLHVSVGTVLAARWELPEPVCRAIRSYRDTEAYGDEEQFEAALTRGAAALATDLLSPEASEPSARTLAAPAFAGLNLYPEEVDAVVAKGDDVRGLVDAMAAS